MDIIISRVGKDVYVECEMCNQLQAENKKLKELLQQFQTAKLYDEEAAPPKEILKCGI